MITSPALWGALVLIATGAIIFLLKSKSQAINSTVVAVILSVAFALGYFHLVDTYLMTMQGLDYWYLFRG